MKTLQFIAILLLAFALHGCAAHQTPRAGYPMPIPGCQQAYAFVPKGCYSQDLPDRLEVRCANNQTTKFFHCHA